MNARVHPVPQSDYERARLEQQIGSDNENDPVLSLKKYHESPFHKDTIQYNSCIRGSDAVCPEQDVKNEYILPDALKNEIKKCQLLDASLEKNIYVEEMEEYYKGEFYLGYKCGFGTVYKIKKSTNRVEHEYYQGNFMADYYHGVGTLIKYVEDEDTNDLKENPLSETMDRFKGKSKKQCFTFRKEFHEDGRTKKLYQQNRAIYVGDFEDETRKGIGKYTWEDGTYYIGQFDEDKFNGFGSMKYANGDKYKGEWKDGKMHGFGQFVWKNREAYTGHYLQGEKNGFGNYIWQDGIQYFGNFCDNKLHGTAFLKGQGGAAITTQWNMGKRILLKGEKIVSMD